MSFLKNTIIGLVILTILLVIIGYVLPSNYHVERSVKINASADSIYPLVRDLKKWQDWGVWYERDPNMQVTYTGPDNSVGMTSRWKSETEGNGQMTIIDLSDNEHVTYRLSFPEFDMSSEGQLRLVPDGEITQVFWSNYGDVGSNPINRYFALLMDNLIGPDFQAGLENLKALAENN